MNNGNFTCKQCGRTFKHRMAHGLCCSCRAYLQAHPEGWVYPTPDYGKITYADNGDVVCAICHGAYRKLGSHIRYAHDMDINDYKDKFGLFHSQQLTNADYQEMMRDYNKANQMVAIQKNLIEKGKGTRFKNGEVTPGSGKHIPGNEKQMLDQQRRSEKIAQSNRERFNK